MLELYTTPLDILYLILTISIGLFTLFIVLALFHLISILRNINKVSSKAKDTVDLINHYLWQPIKIAMMIMEKVKEQTEGAKKRGKKEKEE